MWNEGIWNLMFQDLFKSKSDPCPRELIESLEILSDRYRALGRFSAVILPSFGLPFLRDHEIGEAKSYLKQCKLSNKDISIIVFAREGLKQLFQNLKGVRRKEFDSAAILDFVDDAETASEKSGFSDFFYPLWYNLIKFYYANHDLKEEMLGFLDWIKSVESDKRKLRQKVMPIDGDVLKTELGFKQDRRLGEVLKQLKRDFRNSEWSTVNEGLNKAKEYK